MSETYDFEAITPRGKGAVFTVRRATIDQNTIQSCVTQDEYGLRSLDLGDGVALDVGAYIGGVAVALALDNPGARVIAVEPVPENAALVRHNAARNGVTEQVTVLERAVCRPGRKSIAIQSAFTGSESAGQNAWVGSTVPELLKPRGNFRIDDRRTQRIACIDLAELVKLAGGRVAFLKIDAEGAEYELLASPALTNVGTIRGEHHLGYERLFDLLTATHVVTGDPASLGHFTAVAR